MRKKNLRRQMQELRAAMSEAQRITASALIYERLQEIIARINVERQSHSEFVVAVFLAKAKEVCLDELALSLIERGTVVVAPVSGEPSGAPFYRLHNLADGVAIGAFGVREPVQYEGVKGYWPAQVQLVLAPGLAFDRQGGRLGYGGGWYDRILGEVPLSIGACFDYQLVPAVPCEAHDRTVGAIVTETQNIITGVAKQLLDF